MIHTDKCTEQYIACNMSPLSLYLSFCHTHTHTHMHAHTQRHACTHTHTNTHTHINSNASGAEGPDWKVPSRVQSGWANVVRWNPFTPTHTHTHTHPTLPRSPQRSIPGPQ